MSSQQVTHTAGYEAHALTSMWNKLSQAKLCIKDACDLGVIDENHRDATCNQVSTVMYSIDARLREIEQERGKYAC